MSITNHDRVGKGLQLLADGLGPVVERECRNAFGKNWAVQSQQARAGRQGQGQKREGKPGSNTQDIAFLLGMIKDEWEKVFRKKLARHDRSLVFELYDIRNKWAHQERFSTDDAYRALDSAHRLLLSVSAGPEANEVDKLRQDLLRRKYDDQMRTDRRKSVSVGVESQAENGLASWREVRPPHKDVASGRFEMAEFAADLQQVWKGEGSEEYRDPVEFFRRTFLTAGLKGLLKTAALRLSGTGGDPIVQLQTNFGGGKTHSLIALYHLASGVPVTRLAGVEELLAGTGLVMPAKVGRAVLVGQQIQPGAVIREEDGTEVRTLWGELAWQLGGAEGFALVADADRTSTNPGAALTDLLRQQAPCLILIDEWIAYARGLYGVDGLPAGSFDTHFSFAQALTDAARAVPSALLVVSIPASDIEVGGEGGRAALERMKNVVGRMDSSWRPASAEEGFEIVSRRLFSEMDEKASRQRNTVTASFAAFYREKAGDFPHECREAEYERRLQAAYPIHPELFDRLYRDWSELDRFQRTRGVLRLMAKVIHTLWQREDPSPLIMPASVPIDDEEVNAELTRYLPGGWGPIIGSDVDGPHALPIVIDKEHPNLGGFSATRRVARAVYMGSAPAGGAAHKGIDDRAVKLACAQPGESPAVFGDALRHLSDRATYLYKDGNRYWYSQKPTVLRLAQDRAASRFTEADADTEIAKRLALAAKKRDGLAGVHAAPHTSADVPDQDKARLVLLGPAHPHDQKVDTSLARTEAAHILEKRGNTPRRYKNMLVFLAADKAELASLREAARFWCAWCSITSEQEALGLDSFQMQQAATKQAELNDTINRRLTETYRWILAPNRPPGPIDPTSTPEWETIPISGEGGLVERAVQKLRHEESLIPAYAGVRLRMDMDNVPLWRDGHTPIAQLWQDYAQYLYLPRLEKQEVLNQAIRQGVASLSWENETFAYAETYNDETGHYTGLACAQQLAALSPHGLLVHPDKARAQLDAEAAQRAAAQATQTAQAAQTQAGTGSTGPGTGQETASANATKSRQTPGTANPEATGTAAAGANNKKDSTAEQTARLTRFYGHVALDPLRWVQRAGEIADAIVNQLAIEENAQVTVSIEVQATAPSGFSDQTRRTVSENTNVLKFEAAEFES